MRGIAVVSATMLLFVGSSVSLGTSYDYQPLPASAVMAEGIDGNTVVGIGAFPYGGFVCDRTSGAIALAYTDDQGEHLTSLRGVSRDRIVGSYDGGSAGCIYSAGTWIGNILFKDSTGTEITGIDGNAIVGTYTFSDNITRGFSGLISESGIVLQDLDGGAPWVTPQGIWGKAIVGFYTDSGKKTHGFIYDGTNWAEVDVAGASSTVINGISGTRIVGVASFDGFDRGFTYDLGSLPNTALVLPFDGVDFLTPPGSSTWVPTGISGSSIVGYTTTTLTSYVATPVPEPLTLATLAAGCVGLGGYVRRRLASRNR